MPCMTMRPGQRMISVLRKEMYSYYYSREMKSKSGGRGARQKLGRGWGESVGMAHWGGHGARGQRMT